MQRMIIAFAIAVAVYFAARTIYDIVYPPPPPGVTQDDPQGGSPGGQPGEQDGFGGQPMDGSGDGQASLTAPETQDAPATSKPLGGYRLRGGDTHEQIVLGGGEENELRMVLTTRGAGTAELYLTSRKKNGRLQHRAAVDSDEPYQLLQPLSTPSGSLTSFETSDVTVIELDGGIERELGKWNLTRIDWAVAERSRERVMFLATLRDPEGVAFLRIRKVYELIPDGPRAKLTLAIENLSASVLTLRLTQQGPVGVPRENLQYNMQRLAYGVRQDGVIEPAAYQRGGLADGRKPIGSVDNLPVWVASCNRYFAAFIRPLPDPAQAKIAFVDAFAALPVEPKGTHAPSDTLVEFMTQPLRVPPSASETVAFELYAGAKNYEQLKRVDPSFVDRRGVGYLAAADTDARCCCTFSWLTGLMTWLLELIYIGVRNYGIAIFILVLIIRGLLHPLAVFQQKSMYRMQEVQLRLKPKMDALKEKYANDKQAFTREQMKLWSDEGVNPAASMVGMLPMLIQMPILIALWTALNTDVNLRHAALDPFWIEDLSVPDALIAFSTPIDIPVLSWLPLLGQMFEDVPSINFLPVLMGVSMYLQQKYMPKPGMEAKKEAAAKQRAERPSKPSGPGGMDIEDQMKQQQLVGYMMAFMFPLLFYYMPAGLNLYWLSSNIVGIAESLRIKAELKREKEHRELYGPPQKRPSRIAEFFKRMAEQAEELQKQADQASGRDKRGSKKSAGDGKSKS